MIVISYCFINFLIRGVGRGEGRGGRVSIHLFGGQILCNSIKCEGRDPVLNDPPPLKNPSYAPAHLGNILNNDSQLFPLYVFPFSVPAKRNTFGFIFISLYTALP